MLVASEQKAVKPKARKITAGNYWRLAQLASLCQCGGTLFALQDSLLPKYLRAKCNSECKTGNCRIPRYLLPRSWIQHLVRKMQGCTSNLKVVVMEGGFQKHKTTTNGSKWTLEWKHKLRWLRLRVVKMLTSGLRSTHSDIAMMVRTFTTTSPVDLLRWYNKILPS